MRSRTVRFLKESKQRCSGVELCDVRTWQDRADISEAIKCLARGMSKPRTGHMIQLKRVARCLKGVPRKAQQYPAQEQSKAHLEVHVDSD